MSYYNNAIYYMGVYFDPQLLGEEAVFAEMYNYNEEEAEEMSQVFRILLDEDLVKVYWTEDNRFYLEDIQRL